MTKPVLTDLQRLLLEALRKSGDWLTRPQIADAIQRESRLNPHDVNMLNELAKMGLIEIDERIVGTVRKQYFYRAVRQD
tara:strand:- start:425 stop:661 length:237 start_codon:yes stop_codon:yes gene_type:complete